MASGLYARVAGGFREMFGKVFGAIVGFCVGLLSGSWKVAIFGAGLGIAIGRLYDLAHEAPSEPLPAPNDRLPPGAPSPSASRTYRRPAPPTPRTTVDDDEDTPDFRTRPELVKVARMHFAQHLCALFVEVARADGDVVRGEVRVVKDFFENDLHYQGEELEWVRKSLKAAIDRPPVVESVLVDANRELSEPERLVLLDALFRLALSDGPLQRSENDVIRRIAKGLEISDEEVASTAAEHLGTGHTHYETLGLKPEATNDQLRRAYKQLALTHHPDKVAHLGQGAVDIATRRFREISEAYEELRRLRGL